MNIFKKILRKFEPRMMVLEVDGKKYKLTFLREYEDRYLTTSERYLYWDVSVKDLETNKRLRNISIPTRSIINKNVEEYAARSIRNQLKIIEEYLKKRKRIEEEARKRKEGMEYYFGK